MILIKRFIGCLGGLSSQKWLDRSAIPRLDSTEETLATSDLQGLPGGRVGDYQSVMRQYTEFTTRNLIEYYQIPSHP